MPKNCFFYLLCFFLFCGGAFNNNANGAEKNGVFNIPKLDGVVIDGQADDWKGKGFQINFLNVLEDRPRPPATDFDVKCRIGWNDKGLLLLFSVQDDRGLEEDSLERLWRWDNLELFLAEKVGSKNYYQVIFSPGISISQDKLRYKVYDKREKIRCIPTLQAVRSLIDNGYICEILLPWGNLGKSFKEGDTLGFQFYAQDSDAGNDLLKYLWFPQANTHLNQKHMHKIRLAQKPAAPFRGVASFSAPYLTIKTTPELIGAKIEVVLDGETIASGRINKNPLFTGAKIEIPTLPPGKFIQDLRVVFPNGNPLVQKVTMAGRPLFPEIKVEANQIKTGTYILKLFKPTEAFPSSPLVVDVFFSKQTWEKNKRNQSKTYNWRY